MHRAVLCGLIVTATVSGAGVAQETNAPKPTLAEVDASNAVDAFKRLHDFLGSKPLNFRTTFSRRVGPHRAQAGSGDFLIERPNRFRVRIVAGDDPYELVSDGQKLTIYNQGAGKYAELPAPTTPLQGLSLFTGLTSAESRVLRFVGLLGEVAEGDLKVAAEGSSASGKQNCARFTVAEEEGRFAKGWVIWLAKNAEPLPCKFAIVSRDPFETEFQVNEFSWNPDARIPAEAFVFTPPRGAEKVESVGALELHPPT
jgi:hypothetical protein